MLSLSRELAMLNAKSAIKHPAPGPNGIGARGPERAQIAVRIIGTLKGERVRLSPARFLPPDKARDTEAARDLAILWEKAGIPVRPGNYTEPASAPVGPEPTLASFHAYSYPPPGNALASRRTHRSLGEYAREIAPFDSNADAVTEYSKIFPQ
jgi:hypothetical protein